MQTARNKTALTRARVATGALALGAVLSACGGSAHKAAAPTTTTTTPSTTASSAPPTTAASTDCPLTGQPAPNGKIPQRPVLAVKVENLPVSRPPYGLGHADVVYEEPVEGGITRFIVLFQCSDAARVEPIRSGRIIDPEIIMQYGAHPLLAFAGGIDQALAAIDSSPLKDLSALKAPSTVYHRDGNRVAPHNLYSSTQELYAYAASLYGPQTTPPASSPLKFGPEGPGYTPAATVHISYQYSDLTWTWNPATHLYQRSYSDTGPATLGDGGQITASNIIIMRVVEYPSPYQEDPTGAHENLLTLTGTGQVQVVRDGGVVNGTWSRPTLNDETAYKDASGRPILLKPGQTWIELVPTTVPVAIAP